MIEEVIALLSAPPARFRYIGGLGDLLLLGKDQRPPAFPAAYVVPLGEAALNAGENSALNAVRQQVEGTVGVIIVSQATQDPKGGRAVMDLKGDRSFVLSRLFGKEPAEGYGPLLFLHGESTRAAPGIVWWQDSYTADFSLFQT